MHILLCILFHSVFPSFTSLFPSFHLLSLHFSTLVLTLNDPLQGNFLLMPFTLQSFLLFYFFILLSNLYFNLDCLFLSPSQASLLSLPFDISQLLLSLILFTSPYDYFYYFYSIPIPAFSLLPTFFSLLHIFSLHLSSVQVSFFSPTLLVHSQPQSLSVAHLAHSSTMKIKAAPSSKSLAPIYQTKSCNILGDSYNILM
jgi:hypothetical protein